MSALASKYRAVRSMTRSLAKNLSAEDQMVQSCPEASPVKWHQAHTTWFFETFVLRPFLPDYKSFHEKFHWLFNSYYWERDGNDETGWCVFTLIGWQGLSTLLDTPVCHISFFEADAFARWRGCRLPDQALASGTFHSILHPTSGTATIYRAGDGNRVLRLTDFKTSNGPDVHVYMVAADDANDSTTVERAGFIDLGSMKGNLGDQNYAVGPDVDLTKYRAVSIWCKRFSVNFGTAPLVANQTISQK
jgi:hypothetical protein